MKKNWKKGGNVGHDPVYLCFYDHNFTYVVRHFNFKNSVGFARTRLIVNAAVVCGDQVVETMTYFRFRHSTRPPSYLLKVNKFLPAGKTSVHFML
jgi:hypothetical protein